MSFILNWFQNFLEYMGVVNKKVNIIFIGLVNSGKSTLLHLLKTGNITQAAPTVQHTSEEFSLNNLTITAHDLGGHAQARHIWKTYFDATDGIVFMVDAADRSRFEEVKKEITNTLLDPDIADIPIAILANKIDLPDAVSEEEFKSIMMLNDSCTGKLTPTTSLTTRPFEVFMCTLKKKSGYGLCFKWLANYV